MNWRLFVLLFFGVGCTAHLPGFDDGGEASDLSPKRQVPRPVLVPTADLMSPADLATGDLFTPPQDMFTPIGDLWTPSDLFRDCDEEADRGEDRCKGAHHECHKHGEPCKFNCTDR